MEIPDNRLRQWWVILLLAAAVPAQATPGADLTDGERREAIELSSEAQRLGKQPYCRGQNKPAKDVRSRSGNVSKTYVSHVERSGAKRSADKDRGERRAAVYRYRYPDHQHPRLSVIRHRVSLTTKCVSAPELLSHHPTPLAEGELLQIKRLLSKEMKKKDSPLRCMSKALRSIETTTTHGRAGRVTKLYFLLDRGYASDTPVLMDLVQERVIIDPGWTCKSR